MTSLQSWLAEHRHELTGRGVWTLGGEPGTDPPALFEQRAARILVARLSTYRDVATSTSHGTVAALLRRGADVFCDFAYLPPPRDRERLLAAGLPLWFGTTTGRPPQDFDLLAISASTAAEFLNLPHLLRASGIPLRRAERLADPVQPLVVLGGCAASHTSVLHGDGGLVDAVIVGDAEAAAPALAALLVEARGAGDRPAWPKERLLAEAVRRVPGFYDPSLYRQRFEGGRLVAVEPAAPGAPFPVRRATLELADAVPEPADLPIPYDPEGAGTARVRISLGCPFACTFCQEGWDQKPYRERSAPALAAAFREAKARQGAHEIDVYAFNFNTHSELPRILREAAGRFDRVALRSQRLDLLAREPRLWACERALGKRVATFGLEGISSRLRRYLGKRLSEANLRAGMEVVLADPPGEIKLFLIATGLEGEPDYAELDALLGWMRGRLPGGAGGARAGRGGRGGGPRVVLSTTPLHAAPHTPLAFGGAGVRGDPAGVLARIGQVAARHGFEARGAEHPGDAVVAQILALGDRRVTPALVRAQADGAALYYSAIPPRASAALLRELAADGLAACDLLRPRTAADALPWDDVAAGAEKTFLYECYRAAVEFRDSAWCFDLDGDASGCLGCGACPTPDPPEVAPPARAAALAALPLELARLREAARSPERLHLTLDVAPSHRHVPAEFWPVAVARALMLAHPALVDEYLGPDPLPEPPLGVPAAGERLFSLRLRRGWAARAGAIDPTAASAHVPGARLLAAATDPPPAPARYEVELLLPGVTAQTLAAAIQRPGHGRPLPLTLEKGELRAAGKKAARSPVLLAEVRDEVAGAAACLVCRPTCDLAAILRAAGGAVTAAVVIIHSLD